MNKVEQRAEEAGAELRQLAERRARTMDGSDSVTLAAKRRGRLQTLATAAMVLLIAVTVGSLLARPGGVIVEPSSDPPSVEDTVVVPDVRALPLPEAQARLEADGLVGAPMTGAGWDDPGGPDAIVVSQKPGAGETVEHGATIGFRTAVVTESLCRAMTRLPARQGDAVDLSATDGYWTMLEDALPSATAPLADAIRELLEVRQDGQPVTGAVHGRALDIVTVHHDACHVLADLRPGEGTSDQR